MIDVKRIEHAFERHDHAALYLSGGKDSLACLHVMKPWWDRLTVMWMDSGDAPNETVRLMREVARHVPQFLRVFGRQADSVAEHGLPVDLVPAVCTPFGRVMRPDAPLMQSRYECCNRVLWQPLAAAAREIGATLLIRGQKRNDPIRPNYTDGFTADGLEVLNPLEHWTDRDVFEYLLDQRIGVPVMYKFTGSNIDCLTCTAYTDELTRAEYLRRLEPAAYETYKERMALIAQWTGPKVEALAGELGRTLQ